MGTGECGKYQLSCIRMSRIHRHLGTALADLRNLFDILNFQSGIYPLGEHIVCNIQNIDVTGTLSVAEQRSLDTFRPGHKRQLCRCNAGSPVIMGVYAQDNAVAVFEVLIHPLNLIGIDIRCCHLNRSRKIDNHLFLRSRSPFILYCGTDIKGKV